MRGRCVIEISQGAHTDVREGLSHLQRAVINYFVPLMVQREPLSTLLTSVQIWGSYALFRYTILALFALQSALHRVARPDQAESKITTG